MGGVQDAIRSTEDLATGLGPLFTQDVDRLETVASGLQEKALSAGNPSNDGSDSWKAKFQTEEKRFTAAVREGKSNLKEAAVKLRQETRSELGQEATNAKQAMSRSMRAAMKKAESKVAAITTSFDQADANMIKLHAHMNGAADSAEEWQGQLLEDPSSSSASPAASSSAASAKNVCASTSSDD